MKLKSLKVKTIYKENSIEKYTFPFRLGRKQKRAILDDNGLEVVIFPVGNEDIAELTVNLLNGHRNKIATKLSIDQYLDSLVLAHQYVPLINSKQL